MAEHTAEELGTTYDCQEYGCTEPARSRVGRYSRCDRHRLEREQSAEPKAAKSNGHANGKPAGAFALRIKELDRAARAADRARAAAVAATQKALDAKNQADEKEREFRALARDLMGD